MKKNLLTKVEQATKLSSMMARLPICCASILSPYSTAVLATEMKALEPLQSECIGRLQFELPGVADVATYSNKRLRAAISEGNWQPSFEFDDGQKAESSRIIYRSEIFLSTKLDPHQLDAIHKAFLASKNRLKERLVQNGSPEFMAATVATVDTGMDQLKAWHVDTSIRALLVLEQHALLTTIDERDKGFDESRSTLLTLARRAAYRPIHAIPPGPGVCLPYAFIKDDGKLFRKIGVTYRLKAHPDITIFIEDSSAIEYEQKFHERNAKPENVMEFYWAQEEKGAATPMWPLLQKRPIPFVGRRGLASFVKIKREDNGSDYGYMAVVRGDPTASIDSPDVKLYVRRDEHRARVKGIEPIDEKTFLRMAEAIAASLRHRPVN